MPTASDTWSQLAPAAPILAEGEWSLFLSHGMVNHIWLINLRDALRDRGHRIFLDHPTVTEADRAAALERSQAGLLIWSAADKDAGRMRRTFDMMKARAGHSAFRFLVARIGATNLPGFVGDTAVVDFPHYKDGPTGGEALRLLLALAGQEASSAAEKFATEQDDAARGFAAQVKGGTSPDRLQALLADGGPSETSSALGSIVAERLTELAEYDAALRAIDTVSRQFRGALRPTQLRALALARRGKPTDLTTAQKTLAELYERGERDPETVGIYARTFMDNYNATGNAASLRKSRDLYAEAYERAPDSYYNGINAAAKSVFLQTEEDLKRGRTYAAAVRTDIAGQKSSDYWDTATLAEAHLIVGEYEAAATAYEQAVAMAPGNTGTLNTTWKQASKLMALLQVPPEIRTRIRKAFGDPPASPPLDVTEEIRFAIVMYGGVSLAIYINGVAQEFLRLVRATAADPKDRSQPLLSDAQLTGTERVYRRAAQLLGRERDEIKRAVTPDDPIRARFVVDILSGTSAGGINAIFLAKALANNQSIDRLKQLWVDEGAIEQLINDGKSVKDLDGLAEENPPTSLLNGRRMYRKLLDAFDDMDRTKPAASARSPFVDELDLFVTTTDIRGLPISLRLADDVVPERRHRNLFRFRYSDGFSTDAENDFVRDSNPFLAYAARCTSSFPLAFPPMKLTDIDEVLARTPGRQGDSGLGKNAEKWQRFFPAYAPPKGGNEAAPAVYDFIDRAFGDGGYLDNKPFGHATDALRSRRGGVQSQRKLVFIEPSPEHLDLAPPGERPNVIENVSAALSLARYETIRDDLDRVRARNRLIERVGGIIGGMEEDVRVAQAVAPTIRPDFGTLDLKDMIRLYGVAYGGYHRLKVAGLTDELAGLLSRISQYDDRSDEFLAIRYLVRAWRETRYVAHKTEVGDAPRCKTSAPVEPETENQFLARYDLPYRLRRLEFVLGKIDQLSSIDHLTEELFKQRKAAVMPQSEGDRAAFRAELARLRGELRAIYEPLRRGRDALRMRGTDNPIAESVRDLEVRQEDLHGVLEGATDHDRLERACTLLADPRRTAALDKLAEALTAHVSSLTIKASEQCTTLLAIPQTDGERSAQAQAQPEANPYAAVAVDFVRHYYESYERYDLISYPILQSSEVGEELDTVDVVRISPEDARSLIDERKPGRRKLAGTKLMNFGAFLDRGWRENDILWGRMDSAERILSTILPSNEPEMQSLLKEAQLAILEEEYGNADRDRLCQLLVEGLVTQRSPDKSETALRALAEKELGSPISPALQAVLRAKLDREVLHGFFGSGYEVNPNLNPKAAVQSLARSTRVIGAMLEQLAGEYKVGASPSIWLSRLARAFWRLVEVAVPNSLPNLIVLHWLNLLYLFEVLLIIGGILFAEAAIGRFGWAALLVTGVVHLALGALGRVMQGKRPWPRFVLAAAGGVLLVTFGVGAFTLANETVRGTLWREIKSSFRGTY